MKIVIPCKYPVDEISKLNGSLAFVKATTHHLSQIKDREVHIITFGGKNEQFKKGNLRFHIIRRLVPVWFYLFTGPIEIWLVMREIMKINPEVVHVLQASPPYATATVFVRNKYPIVVSVIGIPAKEKNYQKVISRLIWELVHKPNANFVYSKIPNIIVESSSIKNLISNMTNSKIYVVPNGIDFEKIRQIEPHLNDKTDIFLAVGLTKIKGVDILIKAIPMVIKSVPNLDVRIAGSGPQENELKGLVKKMDLDKHIKFLGFVSEEEKFQYYKACKIAVVPSRWDVMPATLLEAMSSGKPVVASRIGGIQDTVEDGKTGFLFESENVEDLADKIVTLLKDEELREEMGSAAKEKAKSYDWKKIAERTVEIYKEVIADFHEQKAKTKRRKTV